MLVMVVTEAVLSKGTDTSDLHPKNIVDVVVSDRVSYGGTDVRFEQL